MSMYTDLAGLNEMMEQLYALLPIMIPLAILQTLLMIIALIHVVRHPKYKRGNMVIWLLVVILVNIIGPILYFTIGRGEDDGNGGF